MHLLLLRGGCMPAWGCIRKCMHASACKQDMASDRLRHMRMLSHAAVAVQQRCMMQGQQGSTPHSGACGRVSPGCCAGACIGASGLSSFMLTGPATPACNQYKTLQCSCVQFVSTRAAPRKRHTIPTSCIGRRAICKGSRLRSSSRQLRLCRVVALLLRRSFQLGLLRLRR